MKLEQRLARAARHEKRMRVAAVLAWALAVLLPLGIVAAGRLARGMAPLPPLRLPLPLEVYAPGEPAGSLLALVYLLVLPCAWLLSILYVVKSRAALRRTRDEFQGAILQDLQRQVEEIRRQLPPAK